MYMLRINMRCGNGLIIQLTKWESTMYLSYRKDRLQSLIGPERIIKALL
jgi:hypothetical protein